MSKSCVGSHARSRSLVLGAIVATILGSACGTASDEAADTAVPDGGSGPGDAGTAGSGGSGGADAGSLTGGAGGASGMAGSGGQAGSGGTYFTATPTTYAVHASHNLFAFRLCVEVNGDLLNQYPYPFDTDHHLPETNYPGIAVGGQVDLKPLLDEIGASSTVTLHAVRADQASVVRATPEADKLDCDKLLYGFEKLPADDFVTFEDVELGDELSSPIRVLVIDGCLATDPPSPTAGQCGGTYDPTTGNLDARVMGISPYLTKEPSTSTVFPMHLSPSLEELQADHTLELSYSVLGSSAGRESISSNVPGEEPLMTPGEMTPPASMEQYGEKGFTLIAKKSAGDQTSLLEASLANIQRASSPYDTPDAFFTGANGFLMVFLGDASTQSEAWLNTDGTWNQDYDGRGLHALAIPFSFAAP